MKKLVFSILIVLLAIVGARMILDRRGPARSIAATLAPGDTALLLHLPDARRTGDRWKNTALAKIANEPAVQAFLKKPREKMTGGGALQKQIEQLLACDPREVFVAVTAPDGAEPKMLAGFLSDGKKSSVDALFDSLKTEARRTSPGGKSERIKHGIAEIETFTGGGSVFAVATQGRWCFAGNDLDLLKAALDRLGGKPNGPVLRDAPEFKSSLDRMPRDYEAMVFLQPKALLARMGPMLPVNGKQATDLEKIQALTFATKIEGDRMRDTMFVLRPDLPKQPPLGRGALAMTSTDTLLFFDTRLRAPENPDLKKNPALAVVPEIGGEWLGWFGRLAKELGAAGGELGVQMDLASGAMQPGLLVSMETRDAASAEKLAVALAASPGEAGAWKRGQLDGAPLYTLTLSGIAAMFSPVMVVSGRFVLLGLDQETLKSAMGRAKTNSGGALTRNADFHRAESTVRKPTGAFGYADTRVLFQRIYETAKPALVLWLAMSPEAGKNVDAGKLPPAEAIAKHLGPVVYSQTAVENGTLSETVGPVTFGQVLLGMLGGGAAAALPFMQDQIQQMVPPLPGKPAQTAVPSKPAPPHEPK